jgi:hypothetical protein
VTETYCNVFRSTGTPFGLVIGFMNNLQVLTTINYNTVTHLQSLHSNLFTLSAAVFTYSVSLNHTLQIKPSSHTLHLHTAKLFYSASPRKTARELTANYLGQSQSHIATDGQSVSRPWCRAPSGAHDQIFITG